MDNFVKELFNAIKNGNLPEVKRFIEDEKVDIESEFTFVEGEWYDWALSPINYSIVCNKIDILKYLLDQGANMERENSSSQESSLILAADQGFVEIVNELLIRGANTHETNSGGYNFLEIIFGGNHSRRNTDMVNMDMVNMILDTAVFEKTIIKPAKK